MNPLQPAYGGGYANFYDAFVAKLNAGGSALVYSTYLGVDDLSSIIAELEQQRDAIDRALGMPGRS